MDGKQGVPFFLAVSFLIAVAGVVFFVYPAAEQYRAARASLAQHQRRYELMRTFEEQYEYNLQTIEQLSHSQIASYNEIPLILSQISRLAADNNLTQISFTASEPTSYNLDFRILEVRIRAEYEGCIDSITDFLYSVGDVAVNIQEINVNFDDSRVRLSFELSLFAFG